MSGLQLAKRIITVTLMAAAFFVLLSAIKVEATPIRPDVRKVLARPSQSPADFAPARAGWDGPETPKGTETLNATYEQFGPAATARKVHQSLLAAFIPDYRIVGCALLTILLLRRIAVRRRSVSLARAAAENSPDISQAESAQTIPVESSQHAA